MEKRTLGTAEMTHRYCEEEPQMPLQAAKAAWEVRAGVVPGQIDHRKIHRQWWYTSEDYAADRKLLKDVPPDTPPAECPMTRFRAMQQEAMDYWRECNDPAMNNWAELVFIWY